jgi:predicted NUDIX family NTP pyrophosphohydrolase
MPQRSAGILMYRRAAGAPEVFLVHPGGPYWAKKDDGAWSIPKGLYDESEDAPAAARREFEEETGVAVEGDVVALGEFKQPSGKVIVAFALEGSCDAADIRSNCFTLEWPPRSGRMQEFPEVDRAGWFSLDEARVRIAKGQLRILDALERHIG